MNNDDNFTKSNDHTITPELEARVVAWVVGEASAFEVAVLELLCAEQPELAVFKRRMEAVHGLMGEAAKAPHESLRLSPERRAKVLAVIGGKQTAATSNQPNQTRNTSKPRSWHSWALPMAACVTVMLLLAAVIIPTVGKVQQTARRSAEFYERREVEQRRQLDSSVSSSEVVDASPVYERKGGGVSGHFDRGQVIANGSFDTPRVADAGEASGDKSMVSLGLPAADAAMPEAPAYWGTNASQLADATMGGATGSDGLASRASPPRPVFGFKEGVGVGKNELSVAEKPARPRVAITITAGTPQEFTMRDSTESERLDEDRRRVAGIDPFSAQVLLSNESPERLKAAAAEVRRRRQSKDSASFSDGDHFAPPTTVKAKTDLVELDHQFFPIERSMLERMIGKDVPSGGESDALRNFMQAAGVKFDGIPGAGLAYDGAAVIVSHTSRNMERVRNVLNRYEPIREVAAKPDLDAKLRAEIPTATEAISTFSLHVSDASFRLAKAALARGEAPDPATIRPEEFYNAFDYGDPSPVAGEPVSCRIEQAAHPFLQQRNLVRVAMQVPAAGRGAGTPLRLTVMLDTSGSMEREDRAATVRAAFTSLTSLLGPEDRVTLIGFARTPRLLAESVPGDQAAKLIDLAARTPAEGGTNLEEALALAGNLAVRQKVEGAQNRIVLLTDGAANLGDADPQQLAKRVEALRQNGIAFDACGVVADGLDDTVLEALTRKGDGRYTLINSPEDADATFARQLAGAFRPAAKDVKVQVRFNPARVASYRLIGFEQHRLKTEDFRNDAIDAAELAAEEAAVAVYQVEVRPEGEGELGDVSVRFLDTRSNERVERTWTLAYAAQPAAFARATPSLQLAGSAAFLAEKLRGGALAGQVRLEEFAPIVEGLTASYPQAPRVRDFIEMFRQTRRLTSE